MLELPDEIARACAPLFERISPDEAMERLIGNRPVQTELVDQILSQEALAARPDLAAGLWLYVDDLDRSHSVSQSLHDTTGAFWHGIMHRREGDFGNSHYWIRRAAGHPLLAPGGPLDPDNLIDQVASAGGIDIPSLVARQRAEWQSLFEWCARKR